MNESDIWIEWFYKHLPIPVQSPEAENVRTNRRRLRGPRHIPDIKLPIGFWIADAAHRSYLHPRKSQGAYFYDPIIQRKS